MNDNKEHSCDAAEPIVLSEAIECNDGSVYDQLYRHVMPRIVLSDALDHNDGSAYYNVALLLRMNNCQR